jgi:hypothetical protein
VFDKNSRHSKITGLLFGTFLLLNALTNVFSQSVLSFTPGNASYTQQAKLFQTDGSHDDRFGTSVALDGDTLVVGTVYDDIGASNDQGSAYVFVRDGSNWNFQAKLVANDGGAVDRFGWRVAISGDTIVVGSYGNSSGRGAAYIFVRSGSTWTQQQKLTANDGAQGDQFGWSVAISGETVLVGANLDAVNGMSQGSAYVFTRSGTTWTQQQKLTSSDGAANDWFGTSVALDGNTALVGAYFDDIGIVTNQGSAYVFVREGSVWTQQTKLTADDGIANDQFGNSVALDGETALVAAYSAKIGSNTDRGAAYVFVRSGASWALQKKLIASDGAGELFFASSVALDGNTAVIGSPYTSLPGGNLNQGSAYVFARAGTNWTQQLKILANDGSGGDFFGASVSVSGSTVAAGAAEDEVGSNIDQGSAYVFTISLDKPVNAPFDFDGDGKTDVSVFRPSDGSWWYARSSANDFRVYAFGTSTDIITPGDFTGDGRADIAVFRPGSGEWFVQRSEDDSYFSFPFGTSGDIPAPADFDGDGKADAAVFRPSNGVWYILNSSGGGTSIVQFGAGGDKPVAADYDGDSKADIAIFRPSDGSWWFVQSSNAQYKVYRFGVGTDKPVPGDYTGDGKADIAVFRPQTGEWFFQRSEDNSYYSVPFGQAGDVPAPGDYDGDARFDTAVFRPSTANWFVQGSTSGILISAFGTNGDRPVPNAFVP